MKSFHPDLTEEDSPLEVYTSCYNSFFLLRQKNPLSRAPGKPGNFATGRMIENCTVSVKDNYKAIIISSECFKVALRKLKTQLHSFSLLHSLSDLFMLLNVRVAQIWQFSLSLADHFCVCPLLELRIHLLPLLQQVLYGCNEVIA